MGFKERLEVVNDYIQSWFNEHLPGCDFAYDNDFGYYQDEKLITWGIFMTERADATFKDFFENDLNSPVHSVFLYSILHEYGHYVTMSEFDDMEMAYYRDNVAMLRETGIGREDFSYYQEYYNLPVERAASEWAVTYMKENDFECELFEEEALRLLNKAYQSEDIRDVIMQLVEKEEDMK